MREDAWERFLDKSVDLAAAHHPVTAAREHGPTIALWVRLVRWMIAVVRGSVRVPVGGTHTSEPHTFGPNLLQSRTVPPRTSPPRTSLPRAASALGAPLAPFASPAPSSNSLGQGLRVVVAEKVAPKRHTDLAARTSSLAKAIRGAQRARAEGAGADASVPEDERHRREQPRGSEQKTEQDPTFVLDWERHFDSIQALRGLAEQVRSARSVRSAEGLARGAAWA